MIKGKPTGRESKGGKGSAGKGGQQAGKKGMADGPGKSGKGGGNGKAGGPSGKGGGKAGHKTSVWTSVGHAGKGPGPGKGKADGDGKGQGKGQHDSGKAQRLETMQFDYDPETGEKRHFIILKIFPDGSILYEDHLGNWGDEGEEDADGEYEELAR